MCSSEVIYSVLSARKYSKLRSSLQQIVSHHIMDKVQHLFLLLDCLRFFCHYTTPWKLENFLLSLGRLCSPIRKASHYKWYVYISILNLLFPDNFAPTADLNSYAHSYKSFLVLIILILFKSILSSTSNNSVLNEIPHQLCSCHYIIFCFRNSNSPKRFMLSTVNVVCSPSQLLKYSYISFSSDEILLFRNPNKNYYTTNIIKYRF